MEGVPLSPSLPACGQARWKLGQLLARIERAIPRPGGKTMSATLTSFRSTLGAIGLDPDTAMKAVVGEFRASGRPRTRKKDVSHGGFF
jgi:hypothetical protein